MSHNGNSKVYDQLYDECSSMTIADLSYWLEKNGKVLSVGKLENIITLYCETEFDNRFD